MSLKLATLTGNWNGLDVDGLAKAFSRNQLGKVRRIIEDYEEHGGGEGDSRIRRGVANSACLHLMKMYHPDPRSAGVILREFSDRSWGNYVDGKYWIETSQT